MDVKRAEEIPAVGACLVLRACLRVVDRRLRLEGRRGAESWHPVHPHTGAE